MASSRIKRKSARGALAILLSGLAAPVGTGLADSRGVEVVAPGGETVVEYSGSYALLVGVSDYTAGWPDLEGIPAELERLAETLTALGFQVVKTLDPDAGELRSSFTSFIDEHGYRPGNRLLFYFAGHGHTWLEQDQAYLVPADAPAPNAEPQAEFLRKSLHMSQVLSWSRQMTANHALFVFDSCFSGSIFKERNVVTEPPHISRAIGRPSRVFITAGTAGETVPASSVFTPAIVDALAHAEGDLNRDGYITGMELGLHLQAVVPRFAPQSPQFGKHPDYRLSRGDFVFAIRSRPRPDLASAAMTRRDQRKPEWISKQPVPIERLGVVAHTRLLLVPNMLPMYYSVIIDEVAPASPADRAGLKSGDAIYEIGEIDYALDAEKLRDAIDSLPRSVTVDLLILPKRAAEKQVVSVVFGDGTTR